MRLIDADAIKGPIELQRASYERIGATERAEAYANVLWEIDEAPTVGEWVSVKDRLPETDEEVLVTYVCGDKPKKRYVETSSFIREGLEGHWVSVWDEYRIGKVRQHVIAWMPMPKPYKPPKENK